MAVNVDPDDQGGVFCLLRSITFSIGGTNFYHPDRHVIVVDLVYAEQGSCTEKQSGFTGPDQLGFSWLYVHISARGAL
jgi:hypothetical protein